MAARSTSSTACEAFFQRGPTRCAALDGVDLQIEAGEFVALEGPSGSGKTTLLQLLGALDRPSAGDVVFEGRDLARARATASWPSCGCARSASSSSSST